MNRKFISLIAGGFIAILGVLAPVQNANARFVPGENIGPKAQPDNTQTPSPKSLDSPQGSTDNSDQSTSKMQSDTNGVNKSEDNTPLQADAIPLDADGKRWLVVGTAVTLGVISLAGVSWAFMGRRKK